MVWFGMTWGLWWGCIPSAVEVEARERVPTDARASLGGELEPRAPSTDFADGYGAYGEHDALACGTVVTRSVTLRGDIGMCSGDALVAGADDITIDCGGHRIRGVGIGRGVVLDGRASVTVKNCRIEDFAVGVSMTETMGNTVKDNSLRCVSTGLERVGVVLHGSVGDRVARNDILDCIYGVGADHVTNLDLDANRVLRGTAGFVLGAEVLGSRVRRNRIREAGESIRVIGGLGNRFEQNELSDGYIGIGLEAGTEGNSFVQNFVHDMSGVGIVALETQQNLFRENTVMDCEGGGFYVVGDSTRNHFDDNQVFDNDGPGFWFAGGGDDNVLEDNEGCDNDPVDALQDGGTGNRLIDNDFCVTVGF